MIDLAIWILSSVLVALVAILWVIGTSPEFGAELRAHQRENAQRQQG